LNSVYGSRIEDFLRILCQRAGVFACSAKEKYPNSFKNNKVHIHKQKRIIATRIQKLKFHYLLPKIQTSLVQTNQKACLAHTGMSDFGNGVAVAVEGLHDHFDLVDVLWCAALEAARLYGEVNAGVRRHGGQA
jgi:hypothetical protein